jgi:hypothetical protein
LRDSKINLSALAMAMKARDVKEEVEVMAVTKSDKV